MSLLSDLFSTYGTFGARELAGAFGQSDQSISRGMQSAMTTVLGGVASKSNSPGMLQRILDMAPEDPAAITVSNSMTDSGSPLLTLGKRIVSMLFGGSETRITQALGTETGLPAGTMSSLLALAAPVVASFLGKRAAYEGLGVSGLANVLEREAPAIRAALPSSVGNLLQPVATAAPAAPVHAAAASSAARWWVPLLILALIPAMWLLSRARKPVVETPPPSAGTANRSTPDVPVTAPSLPGKLDVHFGVSSMELPADDQAKLKEFATAMAANRDAHISVSGYTDSQGASATNMRLSQARANAIKSDLVAMGVPPDRITAKGFGEQNPVADNATAEGREANRRVSVEISDR
jgi:outer membrane protein OmpA-like peptidoglycan-associated protein